MSVTETKYKVSTATHSIDFSKSDEATYARFSTLCNGRDIGVLGTCFREEIRISSQYFLVNNVGKSHAMPAYFIDTPQDEITDIVAINVNATLRVTYAILPGMVKRYACCLFRRLYHLQVCVANEALSSTSARLLVQSHRPCLPRTRGQKPFCPHSQVLLRRRWRRTTLRLSTSTPTLLYVIHAFTRSIRTLSHYAF